MSVMFGVRRCERGHGDWRGREGGNEPIVLPMRGYEMGDDGELFLIRQRGRVLFT